MENAKRDLAIRKALAKAIKGSDMPCDALTSLQYKEMKVIKGNVVSNGIPYKFEFNNDCKLLEIEIADNE